jgi:hypothetical protein
MPVSYERDDARQCVVATIEGPFQVDDILAIMARQRADRTWTYGILYDLLRMTGELTIADLQLLSEAARGYLGQPSRGPVALLAIDPILHERLSTYAALARSTALTIGVFRDKDEAEQWLMERVQVVEKGGA